MLTDRLQTPSHDQGSADAISLAVAHRDQLETPLLGWAPYDSDPLPYVGDLGFLEPSMQTLPQLRSKTDSGEESVGTLSAADGYVSALVRHQRPREGMSSHAESESPLLACPFYKQDPQRHRECKRYVLRRVKDIKQHIQRRHRRPQFYCDHCYAIFATPNDKMQHDRGVYLPCAPGTRWPPEGISDEQRLNLKQYMSRGKPVQQQWRDMWAIVFPGKQQPTSVYLDSAREGPMCLARRIWSQRRSRIISQALQETQRHSPLSLDDEALNRIVHSLLQQVEDEMPDNTETSSDMAGWMAATAEPTPARVSQFSRGALVSARSSENGNFSLDWYSGWCKDDEVPLSSGRSFLYSQ